MFNKMIGFSLLAVVVGYVLSYITYNYIDVKNNDEDLKSCLKSVHLRTGIICGLTTFVVLFVMKKNNAFLQKGGELELGINTQQVNTGQPGW